MFGWEITELELYETFKKGKIKLSSYDYLDKLK